MTIGRVFERASFVAVLVCLTLLCAAGLRAQGTADVLGTVTDSSGGVLPGATVTLTNTGTNISQTAQTSGGGEYIFNLVQVGTYTVKVEEKGFKIYTQANLTLASGDRARVDAKLEVGDVTQTVEVQASAAPALQTDTSTINTLVTSQAVEDLPLNGRNIIKLVQLSAGTTEGTPGSIAAGNRPDDRRQTSAFSVNGQDDSTNENLIDGFDNNERIIGTIGVRPSIDAIQEVNVSSNKYDAAVGRTGGGVVDVITKAGTNNIHGSGFEFFRNKVLNANPNYNFNEKLNLEGIAAGIVGTDPHDLPAPNPAFRQNQYGGSIGGPIKKDKTFFFFDYEGLGYGTGLLAAFYTVPTLCERGMAVCPDGKTVPNTNTPGGGFDFSDNPAVSALGAGNTSAALCSTTVAPSSPLFYSASSTTCPYVFVPYANTTALGRAFFNMYPLPNTGAAGALTSNYTSAPVKIQNTKTIDGRIDQHFSDKDSLFGRITYNGETTLNPNGFPSVTIDPASGSLGGSLPVTPVVTSYAGPNNEDQYGFGLSYVHVYSPNLLLNLKFGVFRSQILSFPANQGTDVSTKLGFPCTTTSCINYTPASSLVGSSGLVHVAPKDLNSGTSYTTIGDTNFVPLGYWDTNFQYVAGLTWNKGSHSIRFGLRLIRRRAGVAQSNASQGSFSFNGSYTGEALGDLLEGYASSQTRNNALVQDGFREWEPSGYVQDDWRAKPWLTLNLGLRYDIFTAYTEVHGRISNYDPYTGLLVSPALPGLQQSNSTAMVPTPYGDIAPRFGFAASLKHNTVLRGGFGISYWPQNYESQYYFQNAPFNYSETCGIENGGNSVNSCATAAFDGPAGQFSNGLVSTFGTPASGSTKNSSTLGQMGGASMAAGLPVPVLNVALATNTANYAGTTTMSVPPNLQEAYLEQFNLQLQKEFGANVVTVGYVGELGRHLSDFLNGGINQNVAANPTENSSTTLPMVVGGATNDGFGTLAGYSYLSSVNLQETPNTGTSSYNGLQATFVRRFSKGLTVNVNYTWSHTLSNILGTMACTESMFATPEPCWVDQANGTGPSLASATTPGACAAEGAAVCKNEFGWQQYAWGNAPNDVADRIAWAVDYQLPFGKSMTGIEGQIVKGWETNLSGSWQTGTPFTTSPSSNLDGIGSAGYLDQTCSGKAAHPSILDWYNYNCFAPPTPGTMGDERYGSLFGPHQKRLDFSLAKEFQIKEQIHLQFRTEIFNLFNQTNFGQPNGTIAYASASPALPNGNLTDTPTVTPPGGSHITGEITGMSANWNQREIQFALKLIF
jgi:hypothetical protein